MTPCRFAALPFALLALASAPPSAPAQQPTVAAPIVVAGTPIPRAELSARAKAFSRAQALDLGPSSAYVAGEAIDERWALRDAQAAGLLPDAASVERAFARAVRGVKLERARRFYGLTTAQLRTRVRAELAARALADRALTQTPDAPTYGTLFLDRAAARVAQTRCRSPFAPLDRCAGGRDHGDERSILLGVGKLVGRDRRTLELDLAPLLGLDTDDLERAYRRARQRLASAIATASPALAGRVKLTNDSYAVFVRGTTDDLIEVARLAHQLVVRHPTPVLL